MKRWSISDLGELYQRYRILVWLSLVICVTESGFGAIVPTLPLYARSFGVSQSAVGLSLAVYGLARFLVNVPTGQLSDRIGRRWTLVLGEALTAVGNLLCGLSGSFEQFLVFRFLAGIGGSMTVVSGQIVLADISTRENRGRLMSIYQGMFLFGVGFGPLPGGLLATWFGLSAPFYVFAAAGVLAGLLALNKVPETRGMRERRETTSGSADALPAIPLTAQLRALFSQIGFVLVTLVAFAQFFARTGLVFAIVPIMVTVKIGMTPDQIGAAMAVVNFVNIGMVYFTGILVDRFGRKPVIVPSTLMSAAALASFAMAPDYGWVLLASAFWGLASGVAGPSPAAYAADSAPLGMNAITMSSYRMVGDLGYVVGPMLAGWMADVFSNETALYASAVIFVLVGSLFAILAPETARVAAKRVSPRPATPLS